MGWIEKKGEFMKQWRKRYLVLYQDGTLNGYRKGMFATFVVFL